jgi:hypothetical protein
LNNKVDPSSDDLALGEDSRYQSNGRNEEEELREFLEQPEQAQRKARELGASVDEPDAHGQEKTLPNVTESLAPSHKNGPDDDTEIDEALSGVGGLIKSAKENLSMVEAFCEEAESERAELLAKAGITQEDFEQIVTRTGSYLYDVKDCLEGWGDLSMLPETYEQLLLANNQLSEIFKKMYGKRIVEILEKKKAYGEEDNWELSDDDYEDN